LGFELSINTQELSDYLPIIITILNKVEDQYAEVRQVTD
jgi:nitrate reductase assembly molybdenum cofactor insertion protein NarJ